jgi:hypothetical protein
MLCAADALPDPDHAAAANGAIKSSNNFQSMKRRDCTSVIYHQATSVCPQHGFYSHNLYC